MVLKLNLKKLNIIIYYLKMKNQDLNYLIIFSSCVLGFIYTVYSFYLLYKINTKQVLNTEQTETLISCKAVEILNAISKRIQKGSISFLLYEYNYLIIFVLGFSLIIIIIDDFDPYTLISFLTGTFTSMVCGYFAINISTMTNIKVAITAYKKRKDESFQYSECYKVARLGGNTIGFFFSSFSLFMLISLVYIYNNIFIISSEQIFEYLLGFANGGSIVAMFCRVGGGIYDKSADVGGDLVGKVLLDLGQDNPNNPGTIADNVGDNVCHIVGVGSDLFGSYANCMCSSLFITGYFIKINEFDNFSLFPFLVISVSLFVSVMISFISSLLSRADDPETIESVLFNEYLFSNLTLSPILYYLTRHFIPNSISYESNGVLYEIHHWQITLCLLIGLWIGFAVGKATYFFASINNDYVKQLAKSCIAGTSINIIQGLALGNLTCIIPSVLFAISIYIELKICGIYGFSLASLGILCNQTIFASLDSFGPITDNATGIANMANLPEEVTEVLENIHFAGKQNSCYGQSFIITAAFLVSMSIFGAYLCQTKYIEVNLFEPLLISGFFIGSTIPLVFSSYTVGSVGIIAERICNEIIRQKRSKDVINNPDKCMEIASTDSLREMMTPLIIAIVPPITLGFILGPKFLCGYLPGVILTGLLLAISTSSAGIAWDKTKKYIESGNLKIPMKNANVIHRNDPVTLKIIEEYELSSNYVKANTEPFYTKFSQPHKAAVICDNVGDPLKDTCGPALNILMKLSCIVSLVFAAFFRKNEILYF